MATIEQLRSVFGGDSDEAVLQAASKRLGLPVTVIAEDIGLDLGGKWGNRARASVDSAQSQLYGVGEAVGLGDWARRGRESNATQADVRSRVAQEQGAITSYKQVGGLRDAAEYVGGLALDTAPQLGAMGLAALAGGPVAAGGVGYGFALGDVLQNQREQAGRTDLLSAAALAVPYAAVDTLTGIGGRVSRGALARSGIAALDNMTGVAGVAARTGASVARTALTEGAGETFQEVMNQAGRMAVDPNASLTSDEALDRYGESFVGGAALGGSFGAIGGHRRSEGYVAPARTDLLEPQAPPAPAEEPRGLQLGFNPIAGEPPVAFPDGTVALASDAQEYRAQLASEAHPGRSENPADFGLPPQPVAASPIGDVSAPAPDTQGAAAVNALIADQAAAMQQQLDAARAAEAQNQLTPEQQGTQNRADAVETQANEIAKRITERDERAKAQGLKGTKMFDIYGRLEDARASDLIDDAQFAENLGLLKAKRSQAVDKFLTGLAETKGAIAKSDEDVIREAYGKTGRGATKSVSAPVPAPAVTPSTTETPLAPAAPQTVSVGRPGREVQVTKEGFLARLAKAQPQEKARVLAVAGLELDSDPTTGRPVLLQVGRPRSLTEVAAAAGITRQAVQNTLAKFGFDEEAINRMASSWNPETVSEEELGIDPAANGSGFRVESELSKATGQGLVDDGNVMTPKQRAAREAADKLLLDSGGVAPGESTDEAAPAAPEGAVVTDLRENNPSVIEANIRALLAHIEAPNAEADWDETRINYSDLPDTLKADWVEAYVWNLKLNAGDIDWKELARDQARIERDYADWAGQQTQTRPAAEGVAGERSRPALVAPAETGGPELRAEPAGSGEERDGTGIDPSVGQGAYVGEAGQRQGEAPAPVVVVKKTRKVAVPARAEETSAEGAGGARSTPEPKFSKSPEGGSTVARVLTEISKLKLDLNADKVVVVQTADQLPPAVKRALNSEAPEGGKVQAFVWNGRAYLIADNIKPGSARAVFLHEVGSHMGLDELLTAREMISLVRQVRDWSEQGDTLEGRIARRAIERVANAKTDDAQALSETIAYFVEEAVNAGVDPTAVAYKSDLARWLQVVVRALKAGLQKLKLIDSNELTAQDVVDMAYGAAHLALSVDSRTETDTLAPSVAPGAGKLLAWLNRASTGRVDANALAPIYAEPPSLLKMLGVYRPVVIRGSEARHGMRHPETTPEMIARLPELMQSPRLVSRRPDGSLRFVLDERASDGRPFVVAIQPENLDGNKVYIFKTMFAHESSAMSVAAEVRDERVLYASEEGLARLRGLLRQGASQEVTQDSQPAGTIPAKEARASTADSGIRANSDSVLTEAALAKFEAKDPAWRAATVTLSATDGQVTAQRGVKFSIAADAPRQAKQAYSQFHDLMGDVRTKAVMVGAFTRDLARMAAKVIPSAKVYDDLVQATQVAKTRAEREVERVLELYDTLPTHERGTGPNSVNAFLRDSTMKKAWGFMPEYHKKVSVDPAMAERFKALSPRAQALVQAVFRHGHNTLTELKATVMDTIASEHDALIESYKKANDVVKAAEVLTAKRKALENYTSLLALNGDWPYAPLKRFGNHVVVGMSKAYLDASEAKNDAQMRKLVEQGNHYHVEFFDTLRQARAAAAKLENSGRFGSGGLVQFFEKDGVQDAMYGGRDTLMAFNRLRTLVRDSADDNLTGKAGSAVNALMNDLHLRLLGEASARQSERERKNVSGADADMLLAFATQGRAQAHFIASLKNNGQVQEALLSMKREADAHTPGRDERRAYYNELLRRHVVGLEYKPTPLIEKAMATSSLWMLLTSPSYFLTNATQPFLMSLPVIAGRHGYARSAAAMTRAYRELLPLLKDVKFSEEDYSRLPADVREAVEALADKGAIDISLNQDLGDWGSDGEGVSRKFSQAVSKLRGFSQTIESVNRLATAIAAVRLERERTSSAEAQVEYAGRVIYETHGDYSGYNSPRVMRSGVGRLLTQFRKFQLIQLSMYVRLAHSAFKGASADERLIARHALAFSLSHAFAVGGLLGMPGAQVIGWVLRQVFGDDDEPDNPELTLRRAIGNDTVADLLIKGVPKMAGVDLSGRLGAGGMLSLLPYNDVPTDRKGVEAAIVAATGPFVGGLLPKFADGLSLIAGGDMLKGTELLAPKGLGDLIKGGRLATQGLTQRNGDLVMSADEISVLDGAMQALGLPTNTLTDRAFRADAKFKSDEFYAKRSASIKRQYVQAYRSNDTDGMAEARQAWLDMEAARVANGYKRQGMSDLIRAPREQMAREARTVGGVEFKRGNRAMAEQLDEIS